MANEDGTGRSERAGRSVSPKLVLVAILVFIVVVLAVVNSNKVKLDFVAEDVKLPLFVVIVGAAAIGWVIGWFMGRSRRA